VLAEYGTRGFRQPYKSAYRHIGLKLPGSKAEGRRVGPLRIPNPVPHRPVETVADPLEVDSRRPGSERPAHRG
jgi:hypothetical protein